ncbi:hypothetical protein GCM10012279_56100 [Micromonospora yangpuensis]|uniref:Uncharacterized protein n=1 Tax=Micromonospora yangpuensis TaxID=683228 RepID=A0A1C6VEZ0_9ACTN|nr:hypothetical protein GCM10012279_56100 [Micromonospora yangpuensis]SCL64943.1 hypothetical protein GA0070617_5611 [Micromonospora yangpuensis]
MQPPAGSQVSRVPAQRTPPDDFTPPLATPAPQRPQRGRALLALLIGVLALLASGGAAAGYLLYDQATAPDRSAPDVVVVNYLQAFLVDRDDAKAELFTCTDAGIDLNQLSVLRDDLELRERRFDTSISVRWENVRVVGQHSSAEVNIDILLSAFVNGLVQSERQEWRFLTNLKNEWQVCGAGRVS